MPHPWLKGDHLPLTILMLIGIAIMVLSEVGFRLGWWNDFHTPAFFVGLAVTALAFVGNYLLGATGRELRGIGANVDGMRLEVRQVGDDVRQAGLAVRQVGDDVRQVGQEVRQVGDDVRQVAVEVRGAHRDIVERQDRQTEVLLQIRDRLPPR